MLFRTLLALVRVVSRLEIGTKSPVTPLFLAGRLCFRQVLCRVRGELHRSSLNGFFHVLKICIVVLHLLGDLLADHQLQVFYNIGSFSVDLLTVGREC